MIPRIVFGTQYILPIESYIFDIIIARDEIALREENILYNRIELLEGISGVDYNVYLGDYIFLSIEDEYDNGETWDLIGELISEYVGDGYVY